MDKHHMNRIDESNEFSGYGSGFGSTLNNPIATISDAQRVYLKWENINFYTPALKDDQEKDINAQTGSVAHGILE